MAIMEGHPQKNRIMGLVALENTKLGLFDAWMSTIL